MKTCRIFLMALLPLLLVVMQPAGNAAAALLDLGPIVPQVIGSTEPNLGHGFPLWYRDANRIALELCTDRSSGMCLTAEPNPGLPLSFPDNIGDELFWWSGDAEITTIPGANRARLVLGLEAAYSTGVAVPGYQVNFARIRIRVEPLPAPGEYVVTTPFKKFTFNVTGAELEINHTEDLGIAENVFTGVLAGDIGPFLYCKDASRRPAGYIGNPNVPCEVLGSTFPSAENPSNFFRIQGPNGFDYQTNLFSISGKLRDVVTPTPLEVDKASYSRDSRGVQLLTYATTQPLSNQTNSSLPFPLNFALTGAPSTLRLTGAGLPMQELITNEPLDGKFFSDSGMFPDPGVLPSSIVVTNTADTPNTEKVVPLVDGVEIDYARYNSADNTLLISASSLDKIAAPALAAYMPGMEAPLGTLINGKLSVTFPFTDNTVQPVKTYRIPPRYVTVVSELGGSDTRAITGLPAPSVVPTGTIVINGGAAYTNRTQVTLTLSGGSANVPITGMQFSKDGSNFFATEPFSSTRTATLLPGDGKKTMYVKFINAQGGVSPVISADITLDTSAPSGTIGIKDGMEFTSTSQVQLVLAAADGSGIASMQFSKDGVNYFPFESYSTTRVVTLTDGDGLKTLWVRFMDGAGNVSASQSVSITKDTGKPTGTIRFITPDPASSAAATLALTASDEASGVSHMQFAKNGSSYFEWEPFAVLRNVVLAPGLNTLTVRFKDGAGNISDPVSAIITRN